MIKKAARILLAGFERRFPMSNLMVAAALLDPSVQHIGAVSAYLFDNNKSRADVLNEAAIALRIQTDEQQQSETYREEASKRPNDIRSMLLKKHSHFSYSHNRGIEYEINNFVNLKDEVADVLKFWSEQEKHFPRMAKIASVLLSTPASSAKSESAFSVAGVLLCKRRAMIDPLRARKVLFIHDNFELCKNEI